MIMNDDNKSSVLLSSGNSALDYSQKFAKNIDKIHVMEYGLRSKIFN